MAAKSKGLGKGLGSLLGDVADLNRLTESATPITEEDLKTAKTLKIRDLEPNRDQPRKEFDEEALQELADSIAVHGVIMPLIVTKRDGYYQIIAGERRWRAAKMAGLKEVPVIEKDYTEREIAEISLIENIQRSDLNPIEEAQAYKKLMEDYELTQEELSNRVSKSRTVITNAVRLLKLPEEVQGMMLQKTLSTGHAKVLLGLPTDEMIIAAAKEVSEKSLSVRETEKLVKSMTAVKHHPVKRQPLKNKVAYEKVEKDLKAILSTKVTIKRSAENAGKIEIDYYSLEDLERILDHIQ